MHTSRQTNLLLNILRKALSDQTLMQNLGHFQAAAPQHPVAQQRVLLPAQQALTRSGAAAAT